MQTDTDLLAHAVRLHEQGRLDEAEPLYRDVLAHDADNPSALYLCGLLGLQRGQPDEAALLLGRAAAARPAHLGTLAALATARLAQGAPAEALAASEHMLAQKPDDARALFLRGTALSHLGRPAEAVMSLRASVARNPLHAEAHLNLGNALEETDDLAGAERHCRAALALDPALLAARISLSHVLTQQGRLGESIAFSAETIRAHPNCAEAHWNQGIAHLLAGDFARGWDRYEWRKRHRVYGRAFTRTNAPEWLGTESLAGRRLLVSAEQGLGDTIQFARYLKRLTAAGAQPVLACAPALIPLLSQLAPCVDRGAAPPPHDLRVDQMSLPRRFGTKADNIPPAPYLAADPAREAAWQLLLPHGRRIGLVWAGNPGHSNDRRRSLPPGLVGRLSPPPGTSFVSLQVGPRAGEAEQIGGLVDVSGLLTDFAETAAAIAGLDLVITVDSAVAHLAGALRKPCWVMLPAAPDWRWMLGREDTPWYPSLRLFRQSRPGAWDGVLARIAAALGEPLGLLALASSGQP